MQVYLLDEANKIFTTGHEKWEFLKLKKNCERLNSYSIQEFY